MSVSTRFLRAIVPAIILLMLSLAFGRSAALAAPLPQEASQTAIFNNNSSITIADSNAPPTKAATYPSQIEVSGLGGSINYVIVTINGFSHSIANDVDMLLLGPDNKNLFALYVGCRFTQPGGQ